MLYTVQGGYMLFRWVVCCSGGLYAVQEGNMDVQQGSMLKKIMTWPLTSLPVDCPNADRLECISLVPKVAIFPQ